MSDFRNAAEAAFCEAPEDSDDDTKEAGADSPPTARSQPDVLAAMLANPSNIMQLGKGHAADIQTNIMFKTFDRLSCKTRARADSLFPESSNSRFGALAAAVN